MHNRCRMITAMFLTKDLLASSAIIVKVEGNLYLIQQIDWRKGEQFFMKHLIDGDFAVSKYSFNVACLLICNGNIQSNNGGWQWSASTGTDAQPYFRASAYLLLLRIGVFTLQFHQIFNPLSQSQKVDPNGVYIRRHLKELSGLSDNKRIHEPSVHDCVKFNYPKPIVKHDEARKRAIAAFQAVKNESTQFGASYLE